MRIDSRPVRDAASLSDGLCASPSLVVLDLDAPAWSEAAALSAVFEHVRLHRVPLLTIAGTLRQARQAMNAGAADYFLRPLQAEYIVDAVAARLRQQGSADTGRPALPSTLLRGGDDRQHGEVPLHEASVLFSDIRNFTTAAEKLNVTEVAQILAEYFQRACAVVRRQGGHHLKILGDGLMAVFDDAHLADSPPHAARAMLAGLELAAAAAEFRAWLHTWYGDRHLPPFAIGVGIHCGEIMFGRLGTDRDWEETPLGDAVNIAARIEGMSKSLGWTIVASRRSTELAGAGFEYGRRAAMPVRGRHDGVEVAEVIGLAEASFAAKGIAAPHAWIEAVRVAIRTNTDLAAALTPATAD